MPRKPQPSIFIGMPPPRQSLVSRSFVLWACLALFVVGAEITWFNAAVFWREARARAWPTIDARIVAVSIESDSLGTLGGWPWGPKVEERFHLSYDYAARGSEYTGTRVGIRPHAARVAGHPDRFFLGRPITIHYNPSQPDESVIDAALPVANGVGTAFGLLLVFFAVRTYRRHLQAQRSMADANEY